MPYQLIKLTEMTALHWKFAKKIANYKKKDPTLMSKEEFFAKLERAEAQYARGEYSVILPNEDLTTHLRRMGYEI